MWTIICKFINDTQAKGFCKFEFAEPKPKVKFSSHLFFLFMMSTKSQEFHPPPPTPTSKIIQFWSDTLPHNTTDIHN